MPFINLSESHYQAKHLVNTMLLDIDTKASINLSILWRIATLI